MTKLKRPAEQQDESLVLLRMIEQFNLIIVALLTLSSWYWGSWQLAQSVLIGGVLSSSSFFLLKRNVVQIVNALPPVGEKKQIAQQAKTQGFAWKFYARLTVFALLLATLGLNASINIIGLVIGLSTVMISVVIVVLTQGKRLF